MGHSAMSIGAGWAIIATWAPSKAPPSSSRILPPPPSSAGVPMTRTVSPRSSATSARAMPAPDGGGGDDVVAAGVADAGQRVVLGADDDVERAADPARRLEGGGQAADARLDGEPVPVERLTEPGGRPLLLPFDLGVGVDAVAEGDHARPRPGRRPPGLRPWCRSAWPRAYDRSARSADLVSAVTTLRTARVRASGARSGRACSGPPWRRPVGGRGRGGGRCPRRRRPALRCRRRRSPPAAARAVPTGSVAGGGPAELARPSVTTTITGRRSGSRWRAERATSSAARRPGPSGVRAAGRQVGQAGPGHLDASRRPERHLRLVAGEGHEGHPVAPLVGVEQQRDGGALGRLHAGGRPHGARRVDAEHDEVGRAGLPDRLPEIGPLHHRRAVVRPGRPCSGRRACDGGRPGGRRRPARWRPRRCR